MRIAISGLSGCGNTTVSELVAKKLHLKKLNYTFRHLAEDLGKTFDDVQRTADQHPEYDFTLENKQAEFLLAEKNALVSSRLAMWMDHPELLDKISPKEKPKIDLKVWLEASLQTRAKRVATREEKKLDEITAKTSERDLSNSRRYYKRYGIVIDEYAKQADIIINTEHFNAKEVADIIVATANALK